MINKIYKIVITILFWVLFFMPLAALAEEGTFLIRNVIPDKAGKLLFIAGQRNSSKVISYKITKLTSPSRLVVDIQNAILPNEIGKKSININNANFKESVRIAQFSNNPNIVRLVFTADAAGTLDKIKINPYQNSIIFEFEKVEVVNLSTPSIYRDRESESTTVQEINLEKFEPDNKAAVLEEIKLKVQNNLVVKNIEQYNNRILFSGSGIISISEPFVLEAPNRVIFDITDAVLDSVDLIRTFTLDNNDNVRIAQFDAKTVRIVIESSKPDQYTYVVSPDLQSIVISPKNELAFAEFPDNVGTGEVQEIKIIKDNDLSTQIILVCAKPIIHNIQRLYSPDKIQLNMYNIQKPSEELIKNLGKTPQFHGLEVDNTCWNIPVNRSTIVESKLSLDGRVLRISLKDNTAVPLIDLSKYKAKVVIDPGHGGYEPGAHYNGIYEKDITLDVSKRVKKYLEELGFYVVMTRETDKTVSLQERVAITNREHPDVFLSIHVNASENSAIKGLETHWYTLQSKSFALHVQNQMANNITTPDRGIKNSRFYVIHHTNTPAVLAEIGYMSNATEMYQLMTEERREATAKGLVSGLVNYIKSKNPQTNPTGRKKL
ncbi:MAG: hypothetical protein A2Y25_04705 [Candidatus Melainabacteria bacterium GWF2_37_15]|nr:MAG: hypothetical protein A2Y25_04705 [Candidatus Melainabacteria bacterium GWF2_37_15]